MKRFNKIILFQLIYLFYSLHAFSEENNQRSSSLESNPAVDILFLGSASAETPWTQLVISGFIEELNRSNLHFNYHSDHLESARFDEETQYELMFRYLKEKFRGNEPDIFVTAGQGAGHFSYLYQDLFPDSQRILIHCHLPDPENMVFINAEIDSSLIVREMIRLSSPREVIVIGDTDKPSFAQRHRSITRALDEEGVLYREKVNMPLPELLALVSRLPEESAVYITPISRMVDGKILKPYQVIRMLHNRSAAPLFSSNEILLGHGIVGGYLISERELGMMAGEAVAGLLREEGPVKDHDGYGYFYDWREVSRWGFERRLKEGAEIHFRQLSFWIQYRKEIMFLAVIFSLLLTMIIALTYFNRQLVKTRESLKQERNHLEERVDERTKELSTLHEKAEKLARIDMLTKLNNRRAFFEQGDHIHRQVVRYNKSYTILMLDIDFFKRVNDNYGHAAGDKVIISVAETIRSAVRLSDIAARIGGEEFALILLETKHEPLSALAERIRKDIAEKTIPSDGKKIKITISIGLAEYLEGDPGIEPVLARADKALYQAKESGRNRVCIYED